MDRNWKFLSVSVDYTHSFRIKLKYSGIIINFSHTIPFYYKIILKKVHHDSFLRGELMKLTEAKLPNSYNSSLNTRESFTAIPRKRRLTL